MKVLFIHQYFVTPEEGGGIRSYHMAKTLVARGHRVDMLTAHNGKKYRFALVEGIRVHYLPVYYDNRLGFAGRAYAFFKFAVLCFRRGSKIKDAGLCYASSSPLTTGLIALLLKKTNKLPYVFEVMDLWPEAPIQMGFIRNALAKRFWYGVEKKCYRQALAVVAASPGMEAGVRAKAPGKNVLMIPNLADVDFFKPGEKEAGDKTFVIAYAGALGLANDPLQLVSLAAYCQSRGLPYRFKVAGKGALLGNVTAATRARELDNVEFLGHLDKNGIRALYRQSDANLVLFAGKPVLQTNSPNKFFDGLAAGLVTLTNTPGWIADLCREHRCGLYFENPEHLVKQLEALRGKATLAEMKQNARQLAALRFSAPLLLQRWAVFLEELEGTARESVKKER